MDNVKVNEALKGVCIDAIETFEKINLEDFTAIKEKLKWVIGSYEFDKNPTGLHEVGNSALISLKAFKVEKPRGGVTKKVLDKLEKSLKKYEEVYS